LTQAVISSVRPSPQPTEITGFLRGFSVGTAFEYDKDGELSFRTGREEIVSMTAMTRGAALVLAIAGLGSIVTACDTTPTVPVPPPEVCAASVPNAEGFCEVGCDEGYTPRDVALVYNRDWGEGVMRKTNEDGSFTLEIEADAGNVLIIQLKHDNDLSAEVAITVPASE
jgi:hypothetical protein